MNCTISSKHICINCAQILTPSDRQSVSQSAANQSGVSDPASQAPTVCLVGRSVAASQLTTVGEPVSAKIQKHTVLLVRRY